MTDNVNKETILNKHIQQ